MIRSNVLVYLLVLLGLGASSINVACGPVGQGLDDAGGIPPRTGLARDYVMEEVVAADGWAEMKPALAVDAHNRAYVTDGAGVYRHSPEFGVETRVDPRDVAALIAEIGFEADAEIVDVDLLPDGKTLLVTVHDLTEHAYGLETDNTALLISKRDGHLKVIRTPELWFDGGFGAWVRTAPIDDERFLIAVGGHGLFVSERERTFQIYGAQELEMFILHGGDLFVDAVEARQRPFYFLFGGPDAQPRSGTIDGRRLPRILAPVASDGPEPRELHLRATAAHPMGGFVGLDGWSLFRVNAEGEAEPLSLELPADFDAATGAEDASADTVLCSGPAQDLYVLEGNALYRLHAE